MAKKETERTALTEAADTGAGEPRLPSAAQKARDHAAGPEAGCTIVSNHSDQQEAWEIAADLIADLGAGDAVAWADDYMLGLHEKGDWRGMQRWGMVASALDELAAARVH